MSWSALFGSLRHPWFDPAVVVLLACWGTLAVLGLRALPALVRRWRTGPWTLDGAGLDAVALALAALATALSLGLAPFAPEIRWRLAYAYWAPEGFGLSDVEKYGLGWPLLVRLLVLAVGPSYEAPFVLNAVLTGAAVLPMVALARAVGARPETAAWCGAAFATTPLLVRFGHTDSPFAADALFALLASLGVARAARCGGSVWLVVAATATVITAQMRVESITTAGFAVLFALALTPGFPWRRPATWAAAAAVGVLLVPHAFLVGGQLVEELSYRYDGSPGWTRWFGFRHYVFFNPTMQSWALIAALPLGLLCREVPWRVRAWAALVTLVMGSLTVDVHPDRTSFSVARYQLRALPTAALLAGFGFGTVTAWCGTAGARGLVRGLVAAALLAGLRLAAPPSLLSREYEVFRAHLADVGSPCTLVSFLHAGDTGLYPPHHLSRLDGHDHDWRDLDDPLPETGCVVYWRSGACTTHYVSSFVEPGDRHPACTAFEQRWRLAPLATAALAPDPVGPMGHPVRFPDRPIEVGFYRVAGPRTVAAAP